MAASSFSGRLGFSVTHSQDSFGVSNARLLPNSRPSRLVVECQAKPAGPGAVPAPAKARMPAKAVPQLKVPTSKELERMRQFRQQQQFRQMQQIRQMQRANAPPTEPPKSQKQQAEARPQAEKTQGKAKIKAKRAPAVPLNDGLSPEEFRRLVETCDLEEEWRPQVGLLIQLGLGSTELRKLVESRPEVFQTGVATMRKKLQFLRDAVGLSQEELAKVIVKFPRILEYRSEQTVRPRLEFLEKVGVCSSDIAKVVMRAPMIMALSLQDTLEPRAAFLKEEVGLAEGKGGLGKLIARHPQVLTCSEDMMRQRTEFLRDDCGLSAQEIARAVLAHPQVLHYKIDSMKERVDYLTRSVGMSELQVAQAVARFPQIFSLAVSSNLAPKWRYLVEHLGGDINALCAYPGYFSLSLANRIIPRHKYLQQQRGSEATMPFSLSLLKMADKKFATEVAGTTLVEYEEFKEQLLQRNAAEAAFASSDEDYESESESEDEDENEVAAGGSTNYWGVLPAPTVRQPASPSSPRSSAKGLMGARIYQPGRNSLSLGSGSPLVRRAHPQ